MFDAFSPSRNLYVKERFLVMIRKLCTVGCGRNNNKLGESTAYTGEEYWL